MTTIPQQFSAAFIHNHFGIVTGTPTSVQFAGDSGTVAKMLRFKADPDNNDDFLIGSNANNVVFPLAPGDDTGWVSVSNLNQFWYNAISGAVDYLYYWYQI